MKKEQLLIDISHLRPSELNTKVGYEVGDVTDLKGNILSNGMVITPLSVSGPDDDKNYEILCGERRYTALRGLVEEGHEEFAQVPCYLIDNGEMDDITKQIIIESSNLETRDVNKEQHRFKLVGLIKQLSEREGLSKGETVQLAEKYFEISPRYRRAYFQIYDKAVDELQKAVQNGEVDAMTGGRLSSLPGEKQKEAVERVHKGERPKEVLAKVKDVYTEDDLKTTDFDFESCTGNIDMNMFTDTPITSRSKDIDTSKKREEFAHVRWQKFTQECEMLLKKDCLEDMDDYELEAIEACRRVVEKFE